MFFPATWGGLDTSTCKSKYYVSNTTLGLLLFLINDIFLFARSSTLCNYVDGNSQFPCKKPFDQVMNNLQTDFRKLK